MARPNFEGEIENISERQIQFISNVLLKHGFVNSTVRVEHVGKVGDNFAANVKRLIIEGQHGHFNMIAKIAPQLEASRNPVNVEASFKNEHIMYTEVLPKLAQLQEDAGIPKEEQLRYAKCYGSLPESPNEVILLEDFEASNFKILDKYTSLSDECVKSILKNFALMHSLSFVLKEKEFKTFDEFKTRLVDMWILNGNMAYFEEYRKSHENYTLNILEKEEYVNIVRHKIAESIVSWKKLVKADMENKYTVILQGDAWTNNIMFKFHNEKLSDSAMIDYQASKNGSPAVDIVFMMFHCTDHVTRKQHFTEWIDYYYIELQKCLTKFNLSANLVYPRKILNSDLKKYTPILFGLTLILASVLLRQAEDTAKVVEALNSENLTTLVKNLSMSNQSEVSKMRYRNKVIELIETVTEFNLM